MISYEITVTQRNKYSYNYDTIGILTVSDKEKATAIVDGIENSGYIRCSIKKVYHG